MNRIALVCFLAIVSSACFGQTSNSTKGTVFPDKPAPKADQSWTFSYEDQFKSKYVGGNGTLFYNKAVTQASVTASNGPWYVLVWGSYPLDAPGNRNFGTEVDGGFGRTFNVSGGILDVSYTYFDLTPIENGIGDLHSLVALYTHPVGTFGTSLRIEHDVAQNPSVLPSGLAYKVGLNRAERAFGWDVAALGHGHSFGVRGEALSALQLKLTATPMNLGKVTVTPGIMIQKAVGASWSFDHDQTVFFLSITH